MANIFDGIDHCVILVRNLDIAREKMLRLGFTVTPRGTHSKNMGTQNHCMMLKNGYFEILGISHSTNFNEDWRAKLKHREGLEAVPLASENVDQLRDQLYDRGIELPETIEFSRPVNLSGKPSEAKFRLVMVPDKYSPNMSTFVIQHLTRKVVWNPKYLDHANGAIGVQSVTGIHKEPHEIITSYKKLFGEHALSVFENGIQINTGKGKINFVTPSAYTKLFPNISTDPIARPPYLAALSINVTDLQLTSDYFLHQGVECFTSPRDTICIPPLSACGTLIEFT
tara:strand:+ start:589 stop:1437 length:849 start_codon:yes stop_codon:yes gene_type:complete